VALARDIFPSRHPLDPLLDRHDCRTPIDRLPYWSRNLRSDEFSSSRIKQISHRKPDSRRRQPRQCFASIVFFRLRCRIIPRTTVLIMLLEPDQGSFPNAPYLQTTKRPGIDRRNRFMAHKATLCIRPHMGIDTAGSRSGIMFHQHRRIIVAVGSECRSTNQIKFIKQGVDFLHHFVHRSLDHHQSPAIPLRNMNQ
jgi:hypothetical protein